VIADRLIWTIERPRMKIKLNLAPDFGRGQMAAEIKQAEKAVLNRPCARRYRAEDRLARSDQTQWPAWAAACKPIVSQTYPKSVTA